MRRLRRPNDRFLSMLATYLEHEICAVTMSKTSTAKRLRRDLYYMMNYIRQDASASEEIKAAINGLEILVKPVNTSLSREGGVIYQVDDPADPPASVILQKKDDLLGQALRGMIPPEEAKKRFWGAEERERREGSALFRFPTSSAQRQAQSAAQHSVQNAAQRQAQLQSLCKQHHVANEEELRAVMGDEAVERLLSPLSSPSDMASETVRRLFGLPTSPPTPPKPRAQ